VAAAVSCLSLPGATSKPIMTGFEQGERNKIMRALNGMGTKYPDVFWQRVAGIIRRGHRTGIAADAVDNEKEKRYRHAGKTYHRGGNLGKGLSWTSVGGNGGKKRYQRRRRQWWAWRYLGPWHDIAVDGG